VGIVLPTALGLTTQIDAGLGAHYSRDAARHRLFLADAGYIAFYTLVPQAPAGALQRTMGGSPSSCSWFSPAGGLHHLFADPEHGSGFKFLQSFLTFFCRLPNAG